MNEDVMNENDSENDPAAPDELTQWEDGGRPMPKAAWSQPN
jgi:hypothetical protein